MVFIGLVVVLMIVIKYDYPLLFRTPGIVGSSQRVTLTEKDSMVKFALGLMDTDVCGIIKIHDLATKG